MRTDRGGDWRPQRAVPWRRCWGGVQTPGWGRFQTSRGKNRSGKYGCPFHEFRCKADGGTTWISGRFSLYWSVFKQDAVLACFLTYDAERGNSGLLSREKRKVSGRRKKGFREPVAMGSDTYVERLGRSQPGGSGGSLNRDGRGGHAREDVTPEHVEMSTRFASVLFSIGSLRNEPRPRDTVQEKQKYERNRKT